MLTLNLKSTVIYLQRFETSNPLTPNCMRWVTNSRSGSVGRFVSQLLQTGGDGETANFNFIFKKSIYKQKIKTI